MSPRAFLPIALVVSALVAAGCGSSGGGSSSATTPAAPAATAAAPAPKAAAGPQKVAIHDFLFGPARLTVAPGTKVTWTNTDSAPHTATAAAAGGFDTGTIRQGKSATVTLTKPGTYAYVCSFHPYMKGEITVS